MTLDIDDTCDVVHGYQQLSFWNRHHGERCFLPIYVYDTATGRPVAMLLRTGMTPSGAEAAGHIRRLVRHIRRYWPETHITFRGDGHYGRPEVMAFCDAHSVDCVFGLPTNAGLRDDPVIVAIADACAVTPAQRQYPALCNYAETHHGAKSWNCQRPVVAQIEDSTLGMDIRYVVTPRPLRWPQPSSQPYACGCSRSLQASSRAPRVSVSPSPQPAPRRRVHSHRYPSPASTDIASRAVPHKARTLVHQL